MTQIQAIPEATLVIPAVVPSGVIAAHPNGFGFIRDENGDSHFVPPFLMKQFIPGDIVSFTLSVSPKNGKEAVDALTLIERPETFWLGEIKPNFHGKAEFKADDAVHVKFRLPANHGIKDGDVVQVCVAAGTAVGPNVQVTVTVNLGKRNDREFDTEYAIAKWRLPRAWPVEVLDEAKALSSLVPELEAGMEDLRHLSFVTIDGEGTRDLDDAIYAFESDGKMYLQVAIADVARYVKPGSALDREAKLRGTSVYFPDRVIPMLPEVLSNGLCSLNPGQPRAALVCSVELGLDGEILGQTFSRALIQSKARLTYNQVTAYINNAGELPTVAAKTVNAIKRLFDQQAPSRELRGLMEYRTREPKLVRGPDGAYNVGWDAPTIAHSMVEECMLAANRAAALFVPQGSKSHLFRHHKGVDLDKWAETREWLTSIGIYSAETPSLSDFREMLENYKDNEAYPLIEWRVRRSFAPAVYDENLSAHFTLGFPAYTHFTSPIRRYSDLIVHRLALSEIAEAGLDVAADCSERSRRAQMASRFPWDRIKRRALWREEQKTFGARLATAAKRGCKAVVDEWETAAFVPAECIEKLGYAWDMDAQAWMRKTDSARLELGQVVQVKLTGLTNSGPECELLGELLA
jgi:ribonuclease R